MLIAMLAVSVFVILPMAWVTHYWQLGALRFLLGAVNAALLPAVQTLIIYHITHEIAGGFSAITRHCAMPVMLRDR